MRQKSGREKSLPLFFICRVTRDWHFGSYPITPTLHRIGFIGQVRSGQLSLPLPSTPTPKAIRNPHSLTAINGAVPNCWQSDCYKKSHQFPCYAAGGVRHKILVQQHSRRNFAFSGRAGKLANTGEFRAETAMAAIAAIAAIGRMKPIARVTDLMDSFKLRPCLFSRSNLYA
jgi:hypothetical protein